MFIVFLYFVFLTLFLFVKRYWNCYFTALATRKWLYPVLAIWPVFCYDLCYVCDCGFVLADKFIKVK